MPSSKSYFIWFKVLCIIEAASKYCKIRITNYKLIEPKYIEMITPDSPHQMLMKGESDNPRKLTCSKLGKDLGRGRISHAIAEHPWTAPCLIGLIVIITILSGAILYYTQYNPSDNRLVMYLILIIVCTPVLLRLLAFMFDPISIRLISETDDALFFLKLIIKGHSWEEIGEIMNSYLFERGIWPTDSYFYDGQQCYDLFDLYSQKCTDPAILAFIQQTKKKLP